MLGCWSLSFIKWGCGVLDLGQFDFGQRIYSSKAHSTWAIPTWANSTKANGFFRLRPKSSTPLPSSVAGENNTVRLEKPSHMHCLCLPFGFQPPFQPNIGCLVGRAAEGPKVRSGVQVFRCSGVQVFRCSGVQVFRCSGVQVFRCSGVQVFRCSGVQVFRCSGVQVFRCSGVQVFRCSGVQVFRCLGVQVFRCFGVSVFRCLGFTTAPTRNPGGHQGRTPHQNHHHDSVPTNAQQRPLAERLEAALKVL